MRKKRKKRQRTIREHIGKREHEEKKKEKREQRASRIASGSRSVARTHIEEQQPVSTAAVLRHLGVNVSGETQKMVSWVVQWFSLCVMHAEQRGEHNLRQYQSSVFPCRVTCA